MDFKINRKDFNRCKAERWRNTRIFDLAIQSVFDQDRGHRNSGTTWVKFALLDKAYSAGLRRWAAPDDSGWSRVERYVRSLYRQDGTKFRDLMARARRLGPVLHEDNIEEVIGISGEFRAMLAPLIRDGATLQSFYSKYLWFHAGIFPVFDQYAKRGLRTLSFSPKLTWNQVNDYEAYCRANLRFMRVLFGKRKITKERVKQADTYLVWWGDG